MPISSAVRATRTAISPRLAIRRDRIIGSLNHRIIAPNKRSLPNN
jgi:hypothetical protein